MQVKWLSLTYTLIAAIIMLCPLYVHRDAHTFMHMFCWFIFKMICLFMVSCLVSKTVRVRSQLCLGKGFGCVWGRRENIFVSTQGFLSMWDWDLRSGLKDKPCKYQHMTDELVRTPKIHLLGDACWHFKGARDADHEDSLRVVKMNLKLLVSSSPGEKYLHSKC